MKSKRVRADQLVVELAIAKDLAQARRMIMAGEIASGTDVIDKPGTLLDCATVLVSKARSSYVSRGAFKLIAALDGFKIAVCDKVCADIGAATGGFSQVLLERGALKVYAVDVGYGDLALKVRKDPRVIVMERTNARDVAAFPDQVELVVIDASFISLDLLLPKTKGWTTPSGEVVALIKPQFEATRQQVPRGGVVADPAVHREVLKRVLLRSIELGWRVAGLIPSPILGGSGNREFLTHLRLQGSELSLEQLDQTIEALTTPEK